MLFETMSSLSVARILVSSLALLLLIWCELALQNPVQQQQSDDGTRLNVQNTNVSCFTESPENSTLIISSSMVAGQNEPNQQSPTAQFNERRRDMFFENYNIKQIEVVDTSASTNRSENTSQSSPISSPSTTPSQNEVSTSTASSSTSENVPLNGLHNGLNELPIHPQRLNVLLPKLGPSGKPSCLQSPDDTFCETVGNYPNRTIVKNEIDFTPQQFNDIFGLKEIDGRKSYVEDDENEESVCRKVPRVIYPQMAKNQANQWVYVVNEVEYTQAVVAEICEKPGKPCSHLENMPMGMYSRCKQKYSYKRLLALHPTEKRTYPDAFKFPSCCSCTIKYDDEFGIGRSNGRKLESKVDVSGGEGRDSRAMTPVTVQPLTQPDSPGTPGDNSTIEILSQSNLETNSSGVPATSESSTSSAVIAPQ